MENVAINQKQRIFIKKNKATKLYSAFSQQERNGNFVKYILFGNIVIDGRLCMLHLAQISFSFIAYVEHSLFIIFCVFFSIIWYPSAILKV